jgi:SAM-dependent methyltransferase
LEIGCGAGELALDLGERGYRLTAIDPRAPSGSIFREVTLEDYDEPGTFDAVVANRSLHHIHDLRAALEKIRSLLQPGGVLVLNEFAWDQMDEPTAAWYLSRADETKSEHGSLRPETFLERWNSEHDDLHTYPVMRDGLETHFRSQHFEWVPYISRYRLERDDLEAEEALLIERDRIQPIGFRYVGLGSSIRRP